MEINPHTYSQLTFCGVLKTIHYGEKEETFKNGAETIDINIQKNEAGPLSHTVYKKINANGSKTLDVRAKTRRCWQKKQTGIYIYDLGLGIGSLHMTTRAQQTNKQKKNRFHRSFKSWYLKGHYQGSEKMPQRM